MISLNSSFITNYKLFNNENKLKTVYLLGQGWLSNGFIDYIDKNKYFIDWRGWDSNFQNNPRKNNRLTSLPGRLIPALLPSAIRPANRALGALRLKRPNHNPQVRGSNP